MKELSVILIACMLCIFCRANDRTASDFKVVKKQGAITLYERWIKGTKNEPVRELKAEFYVTSTVEHVIGLLKDQSAGVRWNKNASVFKIAGTPNANQWINYIKYNMPMMFDDQECCLLYSMPAAFHEDIGVLTIDFRSTLSPLFLVSPDVKRITGVSGHWRLEQQPNHLLKITYFISSDRNAKIPRFISDPIVRNNLFNTMEGFRSILQSRS